MANTGIVIAECAVALFAVFGLACAWRLFADWIFPPRYLAACVLLQTAEDVKKLDLYLHEAAGEMLRRRKILLVCVPPELLPEMDGENTKKLMNAYKATLCIQDKTTGS